MRYGLYRQPYEDGNEDKFKASRGTYSVENTSQYVNNAEENFLGEDEEMKTVKSSRFPNLKV